MHDGWEIAKRPRMVVKAPEKYVSLNGRGEFVLNRKAFEAIYTPASVQLMFDRAAGRIAIKRVSFLKEDTDLFPVRRYGRGRRMYIVRGQRLLRQCGIEVTGTVRFTEMRVEHIEACLTLILDIKTAIPAGRNGGSISVCDPEVVCGQPAVVSPPSSVSISPVM